MNMVKRGFVDTSRALNNNNRKKGQAPRYTPSGDGADRLFDVVSADVVVIM